MIYERQYKNILSQELLRYLLEGRLPSINEISARIAKILGKNDRIIYQYISQPSRTPFQVDLYNKSLQRIKFDIDIFQEELLDLFKEIDKRISYADLFYKVNAYQLKKIKAELVSILFTISNADFYFLNAYDSFIDTTKLDRENSTDGVINLSERCISIPIGKTSSKKVDTTHLRSHIDWPITITKPASVVSSQLVVGTSFSNIFRDEINSWAYEVRTENKQTTELTFKFPLAGEVEDEVEVLINRLEIIPHGSGQKLKVRVSTDDVNYQTISGYEDWINLESSDTVYALDFETNLVQFVEITLSKSTPDDEVTLNGKKVPQYIFGLKSISAYTTGRGTSARYQSKPFVFDNSEGKISQVSIQADHYIPPGSNIYYYVGIDKGENTVFLPINPIGKSTKKGIPEVLKLSGIESYTNKFTSDISGEGMATRYGSYFQGKSFYSIGPSLSPKPVFGSVSLYRGYKHWYRDKSSRFENVDNSDIYVNFSGSDIEGIYSVYKETPSFLNRTQNSIRSVLLTTTKVPYYDSSKGHTMRPTSGMEYSADAAPLYTIYKVTQTSTQERPTRQFVLTSSFTQNLPITNFISETTDISNSPVLQNLSGTTYIPGIDYDIELEDVGGALKPSGRFTIVENGGLVNPTTGQPYALLTLQFTCTIDPDITHKVTRIQNNVITLTDAVVNYSDSIEITYRYIPKSPDEIIGASIRVSDRPSTSSGRYYYSEGTDYSIDSSSGLIQRLPNGGIPSRGSVYVDYKYRNSIPGMNTFTTWVYVQDDSGIKINLELDATTKQNKLVVDTESGEALYVNSPNGLIDISSSVVTPLLGPGWLQIICRSKDPDSNTVFRTNLIDQVIQLKDNYKKRIFREGNSYFSQIIAFREPMIQKTLNHLKVNTLLNDHNFFAIDDFTDPLNNYIVVNYSPNTTDELYNRIASPDEDPDERPALSGEIYSVEWNSKNQNIDEVDNDIIVRIDLERVATSDGGITPKVFSYQIRAST